VTLQSTRNPAFFSRFATASHTLPTSGKLVVHLAARITLCLVGVRTTFPALKGTSPPGPAHAHFVPKVDQRINCAEQSHSFRNRCLQADPTAPPIGGSLTLVRRRVPLALKGQKQANQQANETGAHLRITKLLNLSSFMHEPRHHRG